MKKHFASLRTIMDKNEQLEVDYYIIDNSFTDEFGLVNSQSFEIHRVRVWVEILGEWVDVSMQYGPIEILINDLIIDDLISLKE